MDITTIMENITNEDFKTVSGKKSIFTNASDDELKRDNSSKTQIQSKAVKFPSQVPDRAGEELRRAKISFPALGILVSRGYRWHYIHDAMLKLRCEELKQVKQSDDEFLGTRKKAFTTLIQDLGSESLQKRFNKKVELTVDQQTELEMLKHKIKQENDIYLRRHPEIGIMIKLVFGALFKNRPHCPKLFVADYVHHLNKNREELVVEDVDIPFDRPVIPEEISSEEEERRLIADFARQIVESCINLASQGQSYVDVMAIIKSMLRRLSPSEEDISVETSISNAEYAVSEVLMSLLTSVIVTRSTSAELIVDELLNAVLTNALPFVEKDSQIYDKMKGSVYDFIQSLLEQLTDKVMDRISLKEIVQESPSHPDLSQISILRKELSYCQEDEHLKNKTKVKFNSLIG